MYEVTAVPNALTVELNVPGNKHKRFHVEFLKRAGNDPFPSQFRDDAQNPPLLDDLDEPEYEVEAVLRARAVRRGRGKFGQALVKWVGWKDPTWEPLEYVKDTAALDKFEETYDPIDKNDGPPNANAGAYFGLAESHILFKRAKIQKKKKNFSMREGTVTASKPIDTCSLR
ncbi:hypothetical protein K3495_g7764 [Podosphaera aphanis]|nr:hypothetical protein K3495_g7764 [Podosphaera aphanis]